MPLTNHFSLLQLAHVKMVGYRPTQIRLPANETEFEKNCVPLFKEFLEDPNVKRLGTHGMRQHGVAIEIKTHQIVGVQCKLKSGRSKLTVKEVHEEVGKALGYKVERERISGLRLGPAVQRFLPGDAPNLGPLHLRSRARE